MRLREGTRKKKKKIIKWNEGRMGTTQSDRVEGGNKKLLEAER